VLAELGCDVVDAEPDLAGVDAIFQTLRAASYAASLGGELERHRELLKDTVVWNIERGLALTAADVERARAEKAALERRVDGFFERHEFLLLPVSQVAPFPVETEWVREIEGEPMRTYIDWMATCYAITCTGLPAISVPAGFTPGGLPIGIQIVGRRGRDRDVLELAYAFEQRTRFGERRPPVAA
jgi:amidase